MTTLLEQLRAAMTEQIEQLRRRVERLERYADLPDDWAGQPAFIWDKRGQRWVDNPEYRGPAT